MRGIWALAAGLLLAACGGADWGVDQQGRAVSAAELQGRWLVINYWADWCAPCRREVPELNRLAAAAGTPPRRVLGVNFDGLQDAALRQASEVLGIRYSSLARDPAARLGLARSEGLPVTWLVDPQGRVRAQLRGEQSAAGIEAQLRQLAAQP
jgi:thiol-disulfide isomerase/thioredoxin